MEFDSWIALSNEAVWHLITLKNAQRDSLYPQVSPRSDTTRFLMKIKIVNDDARIHSYTRNTTVFQNTMLGLLLLNLATMIDSQNFNIPNLKIDRSSA